MFYENEKTGSQYLYMEGKWIKASPEFREKVNVLRKFGGEKIANVKKQEPPQSLSKEEARLIGKLSNYRNEIFDRALKNASNKDQTKVRVDLIENIDKAIDGIKNGKLEEALTTLENAEKEVAKHMKNATMDLSGVVDSKGVVQDGLINQLKTIIENKTSDPGEDVQEKKTQELKNDAAETKDKPALKVEVQVKPPEPVQKDPDPQSPKIVQSKTANPQAEPMKIESHRKEETVEVAKQAEVNSVEEKKEELIVKADLKNIDVNSYYSDILKDLEAYMKAIEERSKVDIPKNRKNNKDYNVDGDIHYPEIGEESKREKEALTQEIQKQKRLNFVNDLRHHLSVMKNKKPDIAAISEFIAKIKNADKEQKEAVKSGFREVNNRQELWYGRMTSTTSYKDVNVEVSLTPSDLHDVKDKNGNTLKEGIVSRLENVITKLASEKRQTVNNDEIERIIDGSNAVAQARFCNTNEYKGNPHYNPQNLSSNRLENVKNVLGDNIDSVKAAVSVPSVLADALRTTVSVKSGAIRNEEFDKEYKAGVVSLPMNMREKTLANINSVNESQREIIQASLKDIEKSLSKQGLLESGKLFDEFALLNPEQYSFMASELNNYAQKLDPTHVETEELKAKIILVISHLGHVNKAQSEILSNYDLVVSQSSDFKFSEEAFTKIYSAMDKVIAEVSSQDVDESNKYSVKHRDNLIKYAKDAKTAMDELHTYYTENEGNLNDPNVLIELNVRSTKVFEGLLKNQRDIRHTLYDRLLSHIPKDGKTNLGGNIYWSAFPMNRKDGKWDVAYKMLNERLEEVQNIKPNDKQSFVKGNMLETLTDTKSAMDEFKELYSKNKDRLHDPNVLIQLHTQIDSIQKGLWKRSEYTGFAQSISYTERVLIEPYHTFNSQLQSLRVSIESALVANMLPVKILSKD